MAEDLEEALCPAHTLAPGLAEGLGLFIKQLGVVAVSYALALQDRVDTEFDILGQQEVLPATVAFDDFAVNEESRTRDCGTGAQQRTGVLQMARFAHKPKRIARTHPACTVVFRVAIRGQDAVARAVRLVHLLDVVGAKHVIGIDDHIGIVGAQTLVASDTAE